VRGLLGAASISNSSSVAGALGCASAALGNTTRASDSNENHVSRWSDGRFMFLRQKKEKQSSN
jgi:hypothetical protein